MIKANPALPIGQWHLNNCAYVRMRAHWMFGAIDVSCSTCFIVLDFESKKKTGSSFGPLNRLFVIWLNSFQLNLI